MNFKKEFDIDKEFFAQKPEPASKRKIAAWVFTSVMLLTLVALCYSAFSFGLNSKFGGKIHATEDINLKQAQDCFFKAMKYYDQGDFDLAIQNFQKQLSIVDDPDAYSYLAKIYIERNNTELAIEYLKKAIEFKPDSFEANYELGKIYFAMNDFKNAEKYLTTASTMQTDNMDALSLTAQAYEKTGRSDDAIVLFENILLKNPDSYIANAKIGEIYYKKAQYKEAIHYLEDSLSGMFQADTALKLAKCYFELDKYEAAISIADEILEQNNDDKQAYSLKRAAEYKLSQMPDKTPAKHYTGKHADNTPIDKAALEEYIRQIENPIKMNWVPPVGSNLRKASVKFTVNKKGELISNVIYARSGMIEFDKSALDAIELSAPFPPLPDKINRETFDIIFTFDYNIKK